MFFDFSANRARTFSGGEDFFYTSIFLETSLFSEINARILSLNGVFVAMYTTHNPFIHYVIAPSMT